MEKEKLSQNEQLCLLQHKKVIKEAEEGIKELNKEVQTCLSKLKESKSLHFVPVVNLNKFDSDLEDIEAANKKLEEETRKQKFDLNYKKSQFDKIKKQIDDDFYRMVV